MTGLLELGTHGTRFGKKKPGAIAGERPDRTGSTSAYPKKLAPSRTIYKTSIYEDVPAWSGTTSTLSPGVAPYAGAASIAAIAGPVRSATR
jgi:hypothetical protein